MKKVIALVLALCMVFAMSTAAFAVTGKIQKLDSHDPYGARHEVAPEDAKTIIRTEGTEENDEYYVTIPADITVPWNDTSEQALNANVSAYLAKGSTVALSVEVPGAMVCTDTTIPNKLGLQVSAASQTSVTAQYGQIEWPMQTLVHVTNFNAPVAEYVATAVYTVVYTPASAA